MVKTVDLHSSKNYLFCCHPHGVLCSGAFSCFHTESQDLKTVFPGLTFNALTLELNFKIPIVRDLILGFGECLPILYLVYLALFGIFYVTLPSPIQPHYHCI